MWPFRRKAEAAPVVTPAEPPLKKAAAFMLSLGAGRYLATSGQYNDLATEGYSYNAIAYACINRIASSIASLDLQLYQRGKGGKLTKIDDHPLLDLLEQPNAAQSGKEFMEWLVSYFYVSGNAYILANSGLKKGLPSELQLLNPGKMKIEPGRSLFPASYEYRPAPDQGAVRYAVDQITGKSPVLQLKTFNPVNPWVGMSPMLAAAFGIDIFNSGNKWNKRLLDNNARPSGALVVKKGDGSPETLSEEQYQRLKEMIDSQFTGTDNAGRPMLLEGGLDWKEMSINPKDLDFLSGKNSAATDIGLVFGVPGQLIGIQGSQTFSNYEQAMLAFWTDTVLPRLGFILEALNRWLVPQFGENLYLWYDEEMIPALEPRRQQKATRINAAEYMTINEKRRAMGLDDVDGGDVVLVSQADIPLDLAGSLNLPEPGSAATLEDSKA